MSREKDILDDLIEEIYEEFYEADSYDPDEFYEDATDFLSVYGYSLEKEVIYELTPKDPVDEINDNHLEVISELSDRDDTVYLRFVLEDGRPGNQPPDIEQVEDSEDFDLQTDYQKQ